MFRKYLKEIGINEDHWPETVYTSAKSEVRDCREKEYKKYYEEVGVNPADTWNLSTTAMMWLYERLVEYRKQTEGIINLEFHTFEVDGIDYTQKQLLDDLIEIAECILCEPENIAIESEVWDRLVNNKDWHERSDDNFINDLEARFWKIWSIVFPAMWW